MHRIIFVLGLLMTASIPVASRQAAGQQAGDSTRKTVESPSSPSQSEPAQEPAQEGDRALKLAEYLSGATFSGKFTIDGKEDALPKTEQYTISKCEKLAEPDMYRMTARIKYGEVDSEVPLDIKILWSGNTPVITLDNFWIPGMGTFGARVLIHSGRYAGTWQHDAVGGHMFGQIKK